MLIPTIGNHLLHFLSLAIRPLAIRDDTCSNYRPSLSYSDLSSLRVAHSDHKIPHTHIPTHSHTHCTRISSLVTFDIFLPSRVPPETLIPHCKRVTQPSPLHPRLHDRPYGDLRRHALEQVPSRYSDPSFPASPIQRHPALKFHHSHVAVRGALLKVAQTFHFSLLCSHHDPSIPTALYFPSHHSLLFFSGFSQRTLHILRSEQIIILRFERITRARICHSAESSRIRSYYQSRLARVNNPNFADLDVSAAELVLSLRICSAE
jgi:hypothetical protein